MSEQDHSESGESNEPGEPNLAPMPETVSHDPKNIQDIAKRALSLKEEDESEKIARLEEEKLAARKEEARKAKKKGALENAASKIALVLIAHACIHNSRIARRKSDADSAEAFRWQSLPGHLFPVIASVN